MLEQLLLNILIYKFHVSNCNLPCLIINDFAQMIFDYFYFTLF